MKKTTTILVFKLGMILEVCYQDVLRNGVSMTLYTSYVYIYICFMYNSSTSMDSYEFSGFLRMEIHRFPSDLLTSRVTKMEPPGLVFDTTRMEELKAARSF